MKKTLKGLCGLTEDKQKMPYQLRKTNLVATQKASALTGRRRENCRGKMKDVQTERGQI